MENIMNKFLYYISIPIICFGIFLVIYIMLNNHANSMPSSNDLSTALGQALWIVFLEIVAFISVIISYIQTLLVLFINYVQKKLKK